MKKKVLGTALAACMVLPCAFGLAGCKDEPSGTEKTMNISINPEVSFVVDADNKIVNVVYENEDAGTVLANVNLVGLEADAAVELMVEYATAGGYVNVTGQQVTVSVNGSNEEDIAELETKVKNQIQETYTNFGISVTVNVEDLTEAAQKQALVAKAMVLAPEKTRDELEAMTNEALVEFVKTKQEELKGLAYDQIAQIKETFGKAENAVLQQIEGLRTQLATAKTELETKKAELANLTGPLAETVQAAINLAQTNIATIETQINNAVTTYQNAKTQAIATAKQAYETHKAALVEQFKTKINIVEADIETYIANGTLNVTAEQQAYWDAVFAKVKANTNSANA